MKTGWERNYRITTATPVARDEFKKRRPKLELSVPLFAKRKIWLLVQRMAEQPFSRNGVMSHKLNECKRYKVATAYSRSLVKYTRNPMYNLYTNK
jgi:hypothetical protein